MEPQVPLSRFSLPPVAGSSYSGTVSFDVIKHKPKEAGSSVSADSASDAIGVTIPRELRGRSEVLVFLSPEPVRGQFALRLAHTGTWNADVPFLCRNSSPLGFPSPTVCGAAVRAAWSHLLGRPAADGCTEHAVQPRAFRSCM